MGNTKFNYKVIATKEDASGNVDQFTRYAGNMELAEMLSELFIQKGYKTVICWCYGGYRKGQ